MSVTPISTTQKVIHHPNSEAQSLLIDAIQRIAEEALEGQKRKKETSSFEPHPTWPLPREISVDCFSRLTMLELGRCLKVCKQFYHVCQDSHLWSSLLFRNWGISLPSNTQLSPQHIYQNLYKGKCQASVIELPRETFCAQRSNENLLLLGSTTGVISVFNLSNRECLPLVELKTKSQINCLQTKDTKLFFGTENGSIGVVELELDHSERDEFFRLPVENDCINCMHVFDDKLAIGHSDYISLWDIKGEKVACLGLLQLRPLHPGYEENESHFDIRAIYGNGTDLFVGLENGKIEHWDLEKMTCVSRYQAHEGEIYYLQVKGPYLISCSGEDGRIKIWDIRNRECIRIIEENGGGCSFQVTGSKLIHDKNSELKILDLETGRSTVLSAQGDNEEVIIRKIWVLGAKIFAVTDDQIYIYDFSKTSLG